MLAERLALVVGWFEIRDSFGVCTAVASTVIETLSRLHPTFILDQMRQALERALGSVRLRDTVAWKRLLLDLLMLLLLLLRHGPLLRTPALILAVERHDLCVEALLLLWHQLLIVKPKELHLGDASG